MRVETVFIDEITVGERRREEFGDIEGLAESIGKFGLFHPVVVDEDRNLVAGERRLRACRDVLGWKEIPCRLYDELSADERREIELEENVRRKDLTALEASKNLVALAETAARNDRRHFFKCQCGEEFDREVWHCPVCDHHWTHADKECRNCHEYRLAAKQKSRGQPEQAGSLRRVAERVGASPAAIVMAQKHVAAVERYPELAIIPTQKDTITVAKNLDKLPEKERAEARSKLMRNDQSTLAILAEKPPMPPHAPKVKSVGNKWRDNLSQIRVFLSSIKSLGGAEELTASWTDAERHAFLAELWEFSGDLNTLIKELEAMENDLKQRVG